VGGRVSEQKCQIGGSGEFEICKESWAAGEGGARKGIDFRYFFDVNTAEYEPPPERM
jgi:hypothetical protein